MATKAKLESADPKRLIERLEEQAAELRRSEARLKESQRIGKTGSWERDPETGEAWWSDELYRIYGEDPATFEPTIENFMAKLHTDDREKIQRSIERAWNGAAAHSNDFRIVLADGTERLMRSNVELRRDENGRPLSIVGTAQDITEQEEVRKALETSEARAQALLDALPDMIFRVNRDGLYLDYHASDRSLLAASPDQIIGRNATEIFEPSFAAEHLENIRRAIDTGEVQLWQYQLAVLDDVRNFEARIISCGKDEAIAIVQDITEQTRLEREAISIGENERRRIGHDLHDGLGQELTAVSLALRALALKLDREESPHSATVQSLTESTGNMISEIRRLARQLSPVFSKEFGLSAALNALAEDVEALSDVKCRASCSGVNDICDTDTASHLYRIAQESINNALRHSGARTIELRCGREGNSIYLEVLDDGTGLPGKRERVEGMGLRSMRYRARILRGRLEVGPGDRGGTRVLCTCPIQVG